ncbi:MAG TPA: LysM peptidoglycan-binding domain-containing protein, partial [Accumulibacter sp.]|nr:LysM peptidoglycan-binding domain-containing protein [Accumulibacter sp.]
APDPDLAPAPAITSAPAKAKTESPIVVSPAAHTHTVAKGESLLKIAQRYGLTLGEVRQINHLRSDKVTIGSRLIVAADQRSDSTPRTVVAEAEKKPLSTARESAHETAWQMHSVQKGETLQKIAQRHDMTLSEIRRLNKLHTDQVNVGSKIKVSVAERHPTTSRAVVAETEKKPHNTQRESSHEGATQTHIVRKGESLRNIAQRYGMTLAELKEINRLRADKVAIGSKLAIAVPEVSNKEANRREALADNEHKSSANRHDSASGASSSQTHVVRKGDTLAKVADRYGMSITELKQRNKLRGGQLVPGTRLAVDDSETSDRSLVGKSRNDQLALLETRQDKRAETRQQSVKARQRQNNEDDEHNKARSKKQPKLAQYTIRRGDTLNSIAKQFRVEKDDLLRWNRLPATAIKPGQTLTIQLVQNSL